VYRRRWLVDASGVHEGQVDALADPTHAAPPSATTPPSSFTFVKNTNPRLNEKPITGSQLRLLDAFSHTANCK
jgi:hypothetical protein